MHKRTSPVLTIPAIRLSMGISVLPASSLVVLVVAANNHTLYLPLVYRQPTPTPTATPTVTPTPTLMPGHCHLSGRVFFDYNGSGLQEEGEPGIQGVPVGNWVVAASPGRLESWTSVTGNGIALQAGIKSGLAHAEGETEPMTVCGYLAKTVVEVGQAVCRGQIIAQSGTSGTILPHVHFDYLFGPPNPIEPDHYIPGGYQKDPFGVVETVPVSFLFERLSGWTKFNEPQFPFVNLSE
jgi:hypothetical protein